jgi:lipopolysaccharide transport system ATP-binding protein
MSDTVISVRNLGKKYRLGATLSPDTLRDHIMHAAGRIFGRANGEPTRGKNDEFWALKDVSFDVKQGEVLGVIGPNGAGKSTLLKILTKITEPTEGEVRMKGRVASLLEVGTGFHQELSGRENIYMNGAILGMTRAEINAKFDEIVAFSGVEKFLDTPVKRYSSGMRVRLGFAVAAHLEPEILLIDEVLAVGDTAFQKKCLGKMNEVSKGGRTVLFISHNMDAILTLCSAVYTIDGGQISEALIPEEGVHRYMLRNLGSTLSERPRFRSAFRPPMVHNLRINDDLGHENTVATCQGLNLQIELRDFNDFPDLHCGILINNERTQRVAALHTRYQVNITLPPSDLTYLSCRVPSLPLVPGSYYVDIILGNGHETVEKLEQAGRFEVVFADVFGTGRIPSNSQGCLVVPCEWQVDKRLRQF